MDMILLKRAIAKQKFDLKPLDAKAMNRAAHIDGEEEEEQNRVEDIVEKYFAEADPSKALQIVPTKAFSELCRRLVLNDDDDAAERIIRFDIEMNLKREHIPITNITTVSVSTVIKPVPISMKTCRPKIVSTMH